MEKTIWTKEGFINNVYHFVEDEAVLAQSLHHNSKIIVPLLHYLEKCQNVKNIGVFVKSGEEIEPLLPFLSNIPIIVLDVPVFTDGRAYSKAARLKTRYDYKGEIRATGNILIDQISNLLRCYFDTLEISHELTREKLQFGHLIHYPCFYQPGSGLERIANKTGFSRRFISRS